MGGLQFVAVDNKMKSDTASISFNGYHISAGPDAFQEGSQTHQLSANVNGTTPTLTWSTSGTGVFNPNNSVDAVYTPSQLDVDNALVKLTLAGSGGSFTA
jgi:hypothetical protein